MLCSRREQKWSFSVGSCYQQPLSHRVLVVMWSIVNIKILVIATLNTLISSVFYYKVFLLELLPTWKLSMLLEAVNLATLWQNYWCLEHAEHMDGRRRSKLYCSNWKVSKDVFESFFIMKPCKCWNELPWPLWKLTTVAVLCKTTYLLQPLFKSLILKWLILGGVSL